MISLRLHLARLAAFLITTATVAGVDAAQSDRPDPTTPVANDSILAPPRLHGITRVRGTTRPFFNITGPGGGAITDLTVERYLEVPCKISLTLTPLALAIEPNATGAIGHVRGAASYSTQFLELGFGVGGRFQHYGPSGVSLAGSLRLGAVDGLSFNLGYVYSVVRNYFTGVRSAALSNVLGALEVPFNRRLALVVDAGFSFDVWVYTTVGLKHRLSDDRGAGAWLISGGFGIAWVLDRLRCQYSDPSPCENAAWTAGLTMSFGLERRF